MIDQSQAGIVPPCRVDATPETLQREADRSVLYGACLLVVRPNTRIKPHIKAAVEALAPAVRAYYTGDDSELAGHAVAYADACGGRAFLEQKAAAYRERLSEAGS
ncbi:MAG TPA: hypothetical protein VFZ66_20150 [Herpetosiphonaceae bacterium]